MLEINDSTMSPNVRNLTGREALSEPVTWDIEFTTPQDNIPPEQALMKYASQQTSPIFICLSAERKY